MNYRGRFLMMFLYAQDIIRDGVSIDDVLKKYDNGDIEALQDFIGKYLVNDCTWMTSIGIIEAMDAVYNASVENGLIPDDKKYPTK